MTDQIDICALKAISSLQRPGKPDLLRRVVELFNSESPKALASIQQGLDEYNLLLLSNSAHTLKSSSAYVGANKLSQRCKELEAAAREDNYTACIALGEGIDDLFAACCLELESYLVKVA